MGFNFGNIAEKDIALVLFLLVFLGILTCFTSYRSEKLVCNLEKHSCVVERYTYYFTKETHFLIDSDNIKDIVVQKKSDSVRVNRHYRSMKFYSPAFLNQENREVEIFHGKYKKYSIAKEKVEEIKRKLESGSNIIEVKK